MPSPTFAFSDVGLEVFGFAFVALLTLVAALLAAAAYVFFRSVDHFEDDVREATMNLTPAARIRFFALYATRRPKNPAVAWFLAVGLGPAGVNFYRGKPYACLAGIVSLNGLGAWWLESLFTAPQFVLIENRKLIDWTLLVLNKERSDAERANA